MEKKIRMLPTLREKRHYLVLTVEGKTNQAKCKEIIDNAILDFVGVLGYAAAGPLFVESGQADGKLYFILSVTTRWVDAVKAAIALLDSGLLIRCIGVSGTIKKAREKFLSLLIAA